MTDPLQLYTGSYPVFRAEKGVPVRTSNGRPKYQLSYLLEFKAPVLFPMRRLMQMQMPQFTVEYRKQLERVGVDDIRTQLEMIADAAGTRKLVLLCFEASRGQCHRGVFADWWKEQTGETVLELR